MFAGDATHKESPVTSVTKKTEKMPAKKPTISPNGGLFIEEQVVEITTEAEGASIYYTIDGTEPAKDNGTKYTEPFKIEAKEPKVTVKAVVAIEGMDNSEVAEAVFTKAAGSQLQTRLVHKTADGEYAEGIGELTEVPESLKDKYSDITKLKAALTEPIAEKLGKGYAPKDVEYSDITLQMRVEGGEWIDATIENFPEDGLKVTMPYPEGTSKEDYVFAASHMFAATSDRLGIEAGKVEAPDVSETEEGIVFTVKSTSPVAIGWKTGQNDNNGGNGNNNNGNPDGTNGTGNGQTPGTDNAGGNGNNNNGNPDGTGNGQTPGTDNAGGQGGGDGTAGGADKSGKDGGALSAILPKTGDTSSMLLWGVLGAICIAVIIVVVIKKRR